MKECLSVSEVARRLGVAPRVISDLFYQRRLSDDVCPLVSGRRLIPVEYVPVIERALQQTSEANATRQEQCRQLDKLILRKGGDFLAIMNKYGVESLLDLTQGQYDEAVRTLEILPDDPTAFWVFASQTESRAEQAGNE